MSLLNLVIPPQVKIALFVGPLLAVGMLAGVQTWRVGNLKSGNDTLQTSLTNLTDASKRATEAATRIKVATETRNDAATAKQDKTDALTKTDYDARLAEYIRTHRVRVQAATGATGQADRGQDADTTGSVDGPHESAIVPVGDLELCKVAVIKGLSFDAWWPTVFTPIEGAN